MKTAPHLHRETRFRVHKHWKFRPKERAEQLSVAEFFLEN